MLEYACRFGYIPNDPCNKLTAKEKPQKEVKTIDFLPSSEARQYLHELNAEPLFWQAFENLLLTTGLRRGEAVGLQWGDLDLTNMQINIRRSVTVDTSSPTKMSIGTTKTGLERKVPLLPRVYGLLAKLKAEQENRFGGVLLPSAYIFSADTDPYKCIYPTVPTTWQRRFVERHNLPKVSPHDLRHTAATLALESGASLKQVQQLLGHADPSTTMRFYTGLSEDAQRETSAGIERLLTAQQ